VTDRTFEVDHGAEGYLVQRPGWQLGAYATIEEAREAIDRAMSRERLQLNLRSLFMVGGLCFAFITCHDFAERLEDCRPVKRRHWCNDDGDLIPERRPFGHPSLTRPPLRRGMLSPSEGDYFKWTILG
jgi:hypothetical protein